MEQFSPVNPSLHRQVAVPQSQYEFTLSQELSQREGHSVGNSNESCNRYK